MMAFQGSLKELPLPDIIQLVSVSGKTGMFDLNNESDQGQIFLREGQIVHAQTGQLDGEEAVYELAIWPQGDFVFTPGRESQVTTIQKSNTNLLMEAAKRIDEWQVLSKRIPSTRLVPIFTDQDMNTSVSFTPQEWAIICKIDERRTIEEVAATLGMSPFEICKHLYGLVTGGLVELKEELSQRHKDRLRGLAPDQLVEFAAHVHAIAKQRLADHGKGADLERTYRLAASNFNTDLGVESVLELINSHEKVVSAALGPNQSRCFRDEVVQLLSQDA